MMYQICYNRATNLIRKFIHYISYISLSGLLFLNMCMVISICLLSHSITLGILLYIGYSQTNLFIQHYSILSLMYKS